MNSFAPSALSPLVPGPVVSKLGELAVGDLLFDGSETQAGEPNLVLVTELLVSPNGNAVEHGGFNGHFVSLIAPTQKRLPGDHTFFVWDHDLAFGAYRRAVAGTWPEPPGPLSRLSPLAD